MGSHYTRALLSIDRFTNLVIRENRTRRLLEPTQTGRNDCSIQLHISTPQTGTSRCRVD